MNLAELRKEYTQRGLSESEADADPIAQFTCWLREAAEAGLIEPNAMTLATIDPDGRPSARMVLLKGVDERGFVFFTNYESRKGRALAAHPAVALVFYWPELERQVRVEGYAEQISAEDRMPTTLLVRSKAGSVRGPRPRAGLLPTALNSSSALPR